MVAQRVSRLLQIISVLQSDTGWKSHDLAERFAVSRTRIFDDIRALREAGVPMARTKAGYRIEPSFFLSSLQLTPEEVLGLLFTAERATEAQPDPPVLRTARAKLLSCLPPDKQTEARERLARTSVQFLPSCAGEGVLEELRSALAHRRRVVIAHHEAGSDKVERMQADPYGLGYLRRAWYLAARPVERGEVETFRVSDILSVESTGLHFTLPDGFTAADHFSRAEHVFNGRVQEITIRFTSQAAVTVRKTVPFPFHHIQSLSNGVLLFHARVDDLEEVASWLMRFGSEAKVLHPKDLARRVAARARDIAAIYEAGPSVAADSLWPRRAHDA